MELNRCLNVRMGISELNELIDSREWLYAFYGRRADVRNYRHSTTNCHAGNNEDDVLMHSTVSALRVVAPFVVGFRMSQYYSEIRIFLYYQRNSYKYFTCCSRLIKYTHKCVTAAYLQK